MQFLTKESSFLLLVLAQTCLMLVASFQINPAPATLMLPLASFGWILYLILALSICGAPVVAEADRLVSERWRGTDLAGGGRGQSI